MSNHSVPTSVPQPTNTHRETTQRGIYTQPRDKVQTHACQRHHDTKHKEYNRHMYRIDESVRISISISELVTNSEHHSTVTELTRICELCNRATKPEPPEANQNIQHTPNSQRILPTAISKPSSDNSTQRRPNTPEILNPSKATKCTWKRRTWKNCEPRNI